MTAAAANPQRRRLYKLLGMANTWCARNLAGWDDDVYRDILRQCGAAERDGRISATTMTVPELQAALDRLKAKGFTPARSGSGSGAQMARAKAALHAKLTACWCALADAGVVRDRSERAMLKFLLRCGPATRVAWVPVEQYHQAIEALKTWAAREGLLDDTGEIHTTRQPATP